ncbi:polysaccharide pyruvyl transferase family protein [Acinetobacter radioresistens]|uniref:polysaccharide pyruvyl transferase family protein n=1 Tax=Acinetobacter radioresistens TaxID=40216 RepID=UPI000C34E9CB|nr:polysaccharide pyruvyl transferase family protein [Acinetobacter radioresistens]PKD84285.1 polysaccharide pyruvyl transferase family protein [Acinetobacter radioresistens]
MAKKIAILTQPLHTNFGGTLQAFALQKTLISLGYKVETLNYNWKQFSDLKKILSILKHKVLCNKSTFPFFGKELKAIEMEHKKFIQKHINYSKNLSSCHDLKHYIESQNFDAVIVGSDQVWRVAYSPRIESFFLDFLVEKDNIKKIAYSASFGIDEWQFNEIKSLEIKNLVKKFNAISVREKSAVNLCKQYLNIEVQHTLDPTFLLEQQEYLKLLNLEEKRIKNLGNIFVYVLDKNEIKEKIIKSISEKLGKKIFYNQPEKNTKEAYFISDLEPYIYPPIESWIKSFFDADFIITDSFHGTVFSIIFNKPFISIVNKERGASRFESILSQLNLNHRMVNNISEISSELLFDEIDYRIVNNKLADLKYESIDFLKKALAYDI